MNPTPRILLSREIRLGLDDSAPTAPSPNGFAAHPPLTSIAPFLLLTARLSGDVDPATGMLINIKRVDRILRDAAVPRIRDYARRAGGRGGADLLAALFKELSFSPARLELLSLHLSPFLALAISSENPAMVQLSQRFEFSAAHRLHSPELSEKENWETFGRCTNPNGHGHNYELEVTVEGPPDARTGNVIPVTELQTIVAQRVIELFDHKHLNLDCAEFKTLNPTVENIARVIHEKLAPAFTTPATLKHIRVWETPKTWAQFPG